MNSPTLTFVHCPRGAATSLGRPGGRRREFRSIPLFNIVREQYGAAFDDAIARNVADAIAEDVGTGDQTGRLVPAGVAVHASSCARKPCCAACRGSRP